jgi:phospholipase C
LTMGYYDSNDIPFYYDLAQNFTVCDNYFCSVLSQTHPNRMLQMTGTLDPAGVAGGPILVTSDDVNLEYTCSWTTMPEILEDAGVSWKVYNPSGASYVPGHSDSMLLCKNVLMYFEQYRQRGHHQLHRKAFSNYGPNVPQGTPFSTIGPNNLAHDVAHNKLPAVSWVIPPDGYDEHPPAPSALGEWYTAQVLSTLMSNPKVWKSTVLVIMYDENDGFFDHVPPPTAPPGTPGEYLTQNPLTSDAGGVRGPIGLGVRVPAIVVSPFSRGGWVCSDTFDHTSQLQFIAERWGVEVPNVSAWRLGAVGNLTTALPNLTSPNTTIPTLPATSGDTTTGLVAQECTGQQIIERNPPTAQYPIPGIPGTQTQPTQGPNTLTPTPS